MSHLVFVKFGGETFPVELPFDATVADLRRATKALVAGSFGDVNIAHMQFSGRRLAEDCLLSDEGVGMEAVVEALCPLAVAFDELRGQEKRQAEHLLHLVSSGQERAAVQAIETGTSPMFTLGPEQLQRYSLAPRENREIALVPGGTLLHYAVAGPHTDLVETLCREVGLLDLPTDPGGETPLLAACRAGRTNHIETLLRHGADATARDNFGTSALHYVARLPDTWSELSCSALERLCCRSNLHAITQRGETALFSAARFCEPAVAMIIRKGADASVLDKEGKSALHVACCGAEQLLRAGCPHDAADPRKRTALHTAAARGVAHVVVALLGAGADPAPLDATGKTPYAVSLSLPGNPARSILRPYARDCELEDAGPWFIPYCVRGRDCVVS